ncbi:EboA domain-containing protein [Parapedobacter tibetensis]|uniref:EboA domain-containing protein n=1 Tax=Parapedobacter tibetensis TaxID=2972951 RepID=UPI00214DB9CE|nr:EboA domain-containing protein [Parapedobacter tibetensis]
MNDSDNHLKDTLSIAHSEHFGLIANRIEQHINGTEWKWLLNNLNDIADPQPQLVARIFTTIPRNIRSIDKDLYISFAEEENIGRNQLPLLVKDWTLVRLIRVWVLMHIPARDQAGYVRLIEQLFKYGEMEELVALYAALPIYHYPAAWRLRCVEGIRSNIGAVRHAIMIHNHYPSQFLDEGAWNQLVLKAFFTDEDIHNIVGLKQRNNEKLAQALVDYAYELHAAKRSINPMLWILVAPFMDARAYRLMEQTS